VRALRSAPAVATFLALAALPVSAADAAGLTKVPAPIDPRSWVLPEDMTWEDYKPIPGFDWSSPDRQPLKKLRAALILADYPDRDFLVTRPQGSDVAGNPIGLGGIPRERTGEFYRDLLNTPNRLNRGHTINEYWLENSYGLVGIDMDSFGPYRMDRPEHQYGLAEYGQESACPAGETCDGDFDTELLAKSAVDVEAAQVTRGGREYLFRFLLHAGYDESGVWQEFGVMRFPDKESVSEPFGNPDPALPNWAPTRYVPWTSFEAARGIWSHATPGVMATQGENDGMAVFAHEFSHILGVLDNYNNSFADPPQRDYSGPWDMMSRGSFNGPGGSHNRWQVPPTFGAAMGSQHMLRDKLRMGFLKPNEVRFVDRTALAVTGPVFADVWAREIPLGPGTGRTGLHGLLLTLTGGDKTPACTVEEDWRCDQGGYENYTLEVVDRMGSDSFTPDHGVLIAKNKTAELAPWKWVVDAHPQDIDKVDFTRPDGSVAKVTKGDYRQLADALFHAGTGPGVVSEYVDEPNRIHFYVLATERDEEGVLSYRVAVRSLDGGGPAERKVGLDARDVTPATPGRVAVHEVRLTNDGDAEDLVRVKATTADGWTTTLRSDVVAVPAGKSVTVPVYVTVPEGARGTKPTRLTVTATSEMDAQATGRLESAVTPLPAPSAAAKATLRLVTRGGTCIRKGRITLRLVSSVPLARARLTAPRRKAVVYRGRAAGRPLRLTGLRGRSVKLRVAARAKDGRVLTTTRTIRACR